MRSVGMGVGPIPVDKIYDEAARDGLSRTETDDFVDIMRRVDNHVVAKAAKDAERRSKAK